MKILLDWKNFSNYTALVQNTRILESQEGEDDVNTKKAKIKTSYAMRRLTGTYPFFAKLLFKLKIIYTRHPEIQTAATDGINLFINPDFFGPMTEDQIMFVLCHEVLHCALLHVQRLNGRSQKGFNIAADYEINWLLVKDSVGGITVDAINSDPLNGYVDPKYDGMNAEQIYNLIPKNPDPQQEQKPSEGEPGSGKDVLRVGDIIRNKKTDGYGIVTNIDSVSGEVSYDPISKETASTMLKN